jgi:thymidylate synthase
MYTTYVSNAQQGMLEVLKEVMKVGKTITVRDQETKEIQTLVMKIYHPDQRVICLPHRNNNIFATIAETLWVLSGRNDIEFLSKYLPRAADFSDDGLTWRAGYGKRLRRFSTGNGDDIIDQIRENIDLLNEDNTTRRAVMSIFDPAEDFIRGSRDIPCNNWIHSMIRDEKLCTTVAVRSNDIIWGMSGINLFEWSVMMGLLASCTDTKIGEMCYLADSCHIYDKHYDRAQKIVNRFYGDGFLDMYSMGFGSIPIITSNLDDWDEQLSYLMTIIESKELKHYTPDNLQEPFLTECGWMLLLHELISEKSDNYLTMGIVLNNMTHGGDFRVAALEYLHRQSYWNKIVANTEISSDEMQFLSQFDTSKQC